MSTDSFVSSYQVYKYLIEKGFPHKASLMLVGDRFMLSRVERNCLFRGVIDGAIAEARKKKMIEPKDAAGSAAILNMPETDRTRQNPAEYYTGV